jgi:Domain of unknown function (DUF3472)
MKSRFVRALLAGCLASLLALISGGVALGNSDLRADSVVLYFDPDKLGESQSLFDHYSAKRHVYMYREIIPVEAGAYTYFAILGANGGYPDFYGGIQLFKDGSKAAIFSAWDVGADGTCWTCLPGTAAPEKQVSVFAKGSRTVTKPFGYEGTGMNSMIHGFEWKLNQKVAMLASIEPSGSGSLISAAFKNGDEPWEFMTSFYVPTKYEVGMPGGYSFVEDWVPGDSMVRRSYLAGPSYLEDNAGKGAYYSNVYVAANNPTGDGKAVRHAIEVQGEWLKVTTGIGVQENAKTQRVQLAKPKNAPDIAAGKALLESVIGEKSDRIKDNNLRAAKEKAEAEAKAASEKAEAEAKAKADAAIRAKSTTITCLKGTQSRIVSGVKPRCPSGFKIQKTIVCVKGKEIQRVSAITPRCPAGYKKL